MGHDWPKAICLLVCFHLLLFRKFYFSNWYVYATSECLEQGFASSRLLGEHLRQHGFLTLKPVDDSYYYPDYSALPFLSTYYWPHRLQAWLGSWLSLNHSFLLYVGTMVLHFMGCSILIFCMLKSMFSTLIALFGALVLSSLGYSMKQNSCIVYTLAWIPVFLLALSQHRALLGGISLGMMLTAGYWPIALYAIPMGGVIWLLGLVGK